MGGDTWNSQYCSDPNQCAQNCALEGVSSEKYENTYGIQQIQDGVKLNFVTEHEYGVNVGSRLYLMEDDENYKLFYLKNREFSYEVDVSELQCGMNGAMYFCEMPGNGGKGIGNNNAGAKFGTGYCDAQCPHDIKFIDGEANVIDWSSNPNDKSNNMGSGKYGSCCAEMDIWEANSMATAYTPHTCGIEGLLKCEGIDCGDNAKGERYEGVCDKDGCDINPYRMGNTDFYGRGSEYPVNTLKPMTVVTQFLTTDGTDAGDLSEIRRFYVQDGEVIHSPSSTILGPDDTDVITDEFCEAKKDLFGDVNHFKELGGMKAMGESLDRGHVMIFSLWDDVEVNMLWLDSAYPLDKPATDPGVQRGDCVGGESSTPTYLRETYPNGYVSFKNAAVGEIGSTLLPANPTAPSPSAPSPTSPGGGGSCGCGPANGMNQPECNGKSWTQCNQMVNNEGKCKWTVCNPPTPAPVSTSSPVTDTNSPVSTPDTNSPVSTIPSTTPVTTPTAPVVAPNGCEMFIITLNTDSYGYETSFTLVNDHTGSTRLAGGLYASFKSFDEVTCLSNGRYIFTVSDEHGDGMCCGNGQGSYKLTLGGEVVKEGGDFGESESFVVEVGPQGPSRAPTPAPTCTPVGEACTFGENCCSGRCGNNFCN